MSIRKAAKAAHDPMALLGQGEPAASDPWTSLARQARRLADFAEHVAALDPADRYQPDTDPTEPATDHMAMLDERALAVRSLVAACRRHTWQALHDAGWTQKQIGDHWNVTDKAVWKVLRGPDARRRPV